ncbi:HNH endonuclease [Finegoldia magna]|uniref:HNH endonuclease n=1 Tax=Finegoldia magna TaxID=1260 RepID=UPI0020B8F511|nr:HNH endonuclease signature motif containing protein [Finegoldia magna]
MCGKPVDKSLKAPNPLAPCIDHIIPVSKGGHPSDISNLQLAHWTCNRQKSDKLFKEKQLQRNKSLEIGICLNQWIGQNTNPDDGGYLPSRVSSGLHHHYCTYFHTRYF